MPLVDTGLHVRYYVDEAASGTVPTQVLDHSGNDLHLTIDYQGNLQYTEVIGERGLQSASTAGTHAARRDYVEAERTAMEVQQATLEVVFHPTAYTSFDSRIFGINGRGGENGDFILKSGGALDNLLVAWGDINLPNNNGFDFPELGDGSTSPGRIVVHVVVDTTLAVADQRCKVYINGVFAEDVAGSQIPLDDTLDIAGDTDLIAFNRFSGASADRSFVGALYYAALYAHAFSAAEVGNNFDILALDDDAPSAGGAVALDGTIACVSQISGALDTQPGLSGELDAASAFSGALGLLRDVALDGTLAATSELTGTLRQAMALNGQFDAVSDSQALLGLVNALSGSISAVSAANGNLQLLTGLVLSGSMSSRSSASGELTVQLGMSGALVSATTLAAALYLDLLLSGELQAAADFAAELSGAANADPELLRSDAARVMAVIQGTPSVRALFDSAGIKVYSPEV